MPFLALTALSVLSVLPAPPGRIDPAPLSCITMNTEKLPLATRKSPLDSLSFKVGSSDVKVCYGRPSLRGRHMLGGDDVPYGKLWRTGCQRADHDSHQRTAGCGGHQGSRGLLLVVYRANCQ